MSNLTPHQTRRQRLLQQLQAQGGGVAILPTAPEVMRNRDSDYPYRHDSSFYYLTGFTEPDAVLVLIAQAGKQESILFCREKDVEREIWDGYRHGPAAAQSTFGFERALPIAQLDTELPKLMANQAQLFYAFGHARKLDTQVRNWLNSVRQQGRAGVSAPQRVQDLAALIDEMRLFKDASEIATMRRSAQIAAAGHVRAMQICRPGLREYHLEAELLHAFRNAGAQSVAYNSIVAAGANSCVLHYRAGDTELKAGDLCLIDAGCELDSYASDITRTFPVSGTFSAPQRALYELVLAAQEAAIALTRPGVRYQDPHDAAVKILAQGMLDVGLLDRNKVGSLDDVLASGAYRQFYMHRTGHWLGMDVHDVGEYREPMADTSGERPWRKLEVGMALTIEPGIYVRPAADVPEQFWNIGIRIEDDAVITADGCELLTRDVPVLAHEIEALLHQS